MTNTESSLVGTRVVLLGGGGISREIARRAVEDGAAVFFGSRSLDAARSFTATLGDQATPIRVDLTDEVSIAALAESVGEADHVVSAAASPANGPIAGLDREAILRAFDAKVFGPMLLAKHFRDRFRPGGSLLLFSGVVAWRPAPERVVMGTANGAVDFLTRALAVELAPVRVNAISPGITDSGSWDSLGDARDAFFTATAERVPARRVGTTVDLARASIAALTNPFMTGTTLHVDGGGRLV